jgi:hypothetical protein
VSLSVGEAFSSGSVEAQSALGGSHVTTASVPSSESDVQVLVTPAPACVVPPGVFDAFGWCASDSLEWRRPAKTRNDADDAVPLDSSNPPGMVFVLRMGCDFLPRELARLHAVGLGLGDEEALAPWGIDEATDALYARRVRPRDVLWLAADTLNALFWGLHDWAHFHSHGPFEQRAWTELQCDATALAWLWINREKVRLTPDAWERVRQQAAALSRARFEDEAIAFDEGPLEADRVKRIVDGGRGPRLG